MSLIYSLFPIIYLCAFDKSRRFNYIIIVYEMYNNKKIGLKYEPEFVERKEIGKVKGREVKSIKKYFIHRFSDEAICLNFSM